ncbi:MAG: hypothetical protein NUV75_11780, partial [Gallionella sp.]|nr:hypothetical protein [Gallionella sp.]
MKHVDFTALEVDVKAKWSQDADLRAEFMSDYSLYFAYRKAEARGGARHTTRRVTTPALNHQAASAETTRTLARTDGDQVDQEARQAWDNDPKVRAEFLSAENYAAFLKAERAGRIRILGAPRQRQAASAEVARAPAPTLQVTAPITERTKLAPPQPDKKEKGIAVALANFALSAPETFAALIAEDRNPAAPAPTGKLDAGLVALDDDMTLAEFKLAYPDVTAAVVAADR